MCGTSSWNHVSLHHSSFSDVNLLVMMYDSESLTNEKIPCRMFEAPPASPPLPVCYLLALRHA